MPLNTRALPQPVLDPAQLPAFLEWIEGNIPQAYNDGIGIATIGIGINLKLPGNMALVLRKLGVITPGMSAQQSDAAVADFMSVIAANPLPKPRGGPLGQTAAERKLRIALDQKAAAYLPGLSFSLNPTEAREVKAEFIGGYTIGSYKSTGAANELDGVLRRNGVSVGRDTYEYKALLSL